ncbi:hypothetical protein GT040_34760 [Streptomyces sp. SID2119]|nr:hypothetical protein [Streptomyces sp. SID2119]
MGCAVLAGAIGWTDALVVAGGVAWKPTGSWTADDGIRPIAGGSYELKWGLKEGTLLIRGSNANPVWPALHGVSCG